MSTRKRCQNGTRRNKKTEKCDPVVRLPEEEISRIMKKYQLDDRARPFLKKLRLKKRMKHNQFFKYDTTHDDNTNMIRQADAIIADIIKYGQSVDKRKIKKTPKNFKKPLGTAF